MTRDQIVDRAVSSFRALDRSCSPGSRMNSEAGYWEALDAARAYPGLVNFIRDVLAKQLYSDERPGASGRN